MIALSEPDDLRERHHTLEAEQKDVARRISRFVALLETDAANVPSVVAKLRGLEDGRRH